MSSRGHAQRRRKRPSTARTLELLNNVNHTNHEQKSSPPYRPRSFHQPPRSETIWDVPNSDSSERNRFSPSNRVPLSAPITPRRSARIQAKVGSEVTSTRGSRGTRHATSEELGEENAEEGSDHHSERGFESDPEEESAEKSAEYSGDDERIGILPDNDVHEGQWDVPQVVLFSGGNYSTSPDNPDLPSPSVFRENRPTSQLEESLSPDEIERGLSHKSQDECATPWTGTPEQADEPPAGFENSSSVHKEQRNTPTATMNPMTAISSSVATAKSAGRSTASTTRPQSKDIFQTSTVQTEPTDMSDSWNSSNAEPESDAEDQEDTPAEEDSPAYIPSDNEGSSRRPRPGLFDYASDPAEEVPTPPRTSSTHQRTRRETGQPSRGRTPASRAANPLKRKRPDEPLRYSRQSYASQQHITDISEDDADGGEEAWLDKVLKLSGQKANWDMVVDEARIMKEVGEPSMSRHFTEFEDSMSRLRANYIDIVRCLDGGRGPPREIVRECDDLMDVILKEGDFCLDDAYYHASDESDPNRPSSRELVDEFEARLVSGMVDVILPCFEAYHREEGHFPKAYNHLHRALSQFLRLCNRIYSMVSEGYVQSKSRSHILRRPLKKLLAALEENLFKEGASQPAPVRVVSVKHGKRWSDDEGSALLEGLQAYQGSNRYAQILEHFGERLRGRTLRSVREKARQVHDNLLPSIDQTDEGRQQWCWLLSVREE